MLDKQILTEAEALEGVRQRINESIGKQWMVAVWCVEPSDEKDTPAKLRMKRLSWKFPQADYMECVNMLQKTMLAETTPTYAEPPAPLELAPFLKEELDEGDEKQEESIADLMTERSEDQEKGNEN